MSGSNSRPKTRTPRLLCLSLSLISADGGRKRKKKGVCLGFTINNRVIFDDFLFLLSYFFFFEHLGSYERDGRDVKESMLPILL